MIVVKNVGIAKCFFIDDKVQDYDDRLSQDETREKWGIYKKQEKYGILNYKTKTKMAEDKI